MGDLCYYKLHSVKLTGIVLGVFWRKLWKEVLFSSEVNSVWLQVRISCLRILCTYLLCTLLQSSVLSMIHLPADCSTVDQCSHKRFTPFCWVSVLSCPPFIDTLGKLLMFDHALNQQLAPFFPLTFTWNSLCLKVHFCMCVHRDGIAANRESYTGPVADAELAGRLQ